MLTCALILFNCKINNSSITPFSTTTSTPYSPPKKIFLYICVVCKTYVQTTSIDFLIYCVAAQDIVRRIQTRVVNQYVVMVIRKQMGNWTESSNGCESDIDIAILYPFIDFCHTFTEVCTSRNELTFTGLVTRRIDGSYTPTTFMNLLKTAENILICFKLFTKTHFEIRLLFITHMSHLFVPVYLGISASLCSIWLL